MSNLENAQNGLGLIKEAIFKTIKQHPNGIANSEIVKLLMLQSDFEGNQKNYLSWSIIGLLVNEERIKYKKIGNKKLYYINP